MKSSLLTTLTLIFIPVIIQAQSSKLVTSYTKTRCMGSCPAFRVEVYANGKAFYSGEYNVERMGRWIAVLSNSELEEIKSIFETYDFLSFQDRYYTEISDLPTIQIEYDTDVEKKKVLDYYGAPQELKQLELELETLIDRINWEEVQDK